MPAMQAHATPPLTINAKDRPFAVSKTHFYVIRHMSDNAGRYSIERSKTYIVKLDNKTSEISDFHKLQEAEQYILEFEQQDTSRILANPDFNLFAYLAEEKAFQTGLIEERAHQAIKIEKQKNHYVLTRKLRANQEEQSVIYKSNLAALVKASYKPILSDYIGPIPDPVPHDEIYLVAENFETLSEGSCILNKVVNAPKPLSQWDYRKDPTHYIAYVKCGSVGDGLYIQAALPLSLVFKPKKQ